MIDKSNTPSAKPSLSIILATTSPFKKALFERYQLAFTLVDPQIDETPKPAESAPDLALRLAREKAVAGRVLASAEREKTGMGDCIVIGCDQVPVTEGGEILHKPGSPERAHKQLLRLAGQQVAFHTAVCAIRCNLSAEALTSQEEDWSSPEQPKNDTRLDTTHQNNEHLKSAEKSLSENMQTHLDLTTVHYRADLNSDTIQRYLAKEQAWRCAGAIQSEALGITLLDKIVSQDPTALIGLPLIGLTNSLRALGLQLP